MRRLLEIQSVDILPPAQAVLVQQGVPEGTGGQEIPLAVAAAALDELAELLPARGLLQPVGVDRFATIHSGMGRNDERTPLGEIFPLGRGLFLFAATTGAAVSSRITEHFTAGDYPLAMALDAAAGLAADLAAVHLEKLIAEEFSGQAALRYSPGYCGWHISGQKALFAELRPTDIGLSLTDSFVMTPLKSVSGVIVVGPPSIHHFRTDYNFCGSCTDRSCRNRIASLNDKESG